MPEHQDKSIPPRHTRRSVIKGLGAVGAEAFLAGIAANRGTHLIPESSLNDNEVIDREVRRLGIKRNGKEINLWRIHGFEKLPERIQKLDEESLEAYQRVDVVIDLMKLSMNPLFSHAGNLLEDLRKTGKLEIQLEQNPRTPPAPPIPNSIQIDPSLLIPKDSPFSRFYPLRHGLSERTGTQVRNDKLLYVINSDMDDFLYNYASFDLALALTHEARHIENSQNFLKPYSNNSAQEQQQVDQQRTESPEGFILEEADAFSVQSNAYIYEVGLTGNRGRDEDDPLIEAIASYFIKTGRNPKNRQWIETIKSLPAYYGGYTNRMNNK